MRWCSTPEFAQQGICGWGPDGDTVVIADMRAFSDKVILRQDQQVIMRYGTVLHDLIAISGMCVQMCCFDKLEAH